LKNKNGVKKRGKYITKILNIYMDKNYIKEYKEISDKIFWKLD